MRKYIVTILIMVLMVTTGVFKVDSQIETKETQYKTNINNTEQTYKTIPEPKLVNPDIIKVQQVTGWDLKTSTYFVEEANTRGVKVFEEALPIASIESGNTYKFHKIHHNTNGSTDGGLFQINDVTYKGIVKQFKSEGREFKSWDRTNPEFNISAGMYWIAYLKDNHQLKDHKLFTSYNRGVVGAKKYASRSGSYRSEYSRKVYEIKNQLIKQ